MDKEEIIKISSIDDFCYKQNIKQIDLLKLDIEGHELSALRGAKNMLKQKAIKNIQFEFGGCNIDSKTFLQDFYYLLNTDFLLYRVVKDGIIPVTTYSEMDEIFITTNYFARLKE